ncbi:cysteine proteinase, partial [Teratosphaeria nubilosa]
MGVFSSLTPLLPQTDKKPAHFGPVFSAQDDPTRRPDKDEERAVKGILERLRHYGIDTMVESNVEYALRSPSCNGDSEAAFRLLMLLQDTYEGIVKPYDPNTKLLGAVNRNSVTCFLDALLFAMFARLDSFEAMLYDSFEDLPRKKLAGFLRLWVNMLRTGRLITTDITAHLQQALSDCGWEEATRLKQQDPSEAFTFITGQLELPLLTLKMDLYHTGKEDPQDDHKFVNERLLEVALLDRPPGGEGPITLEDCLEHYFNNRIEVKRHMENRRRNTLKSANPPPPSDASTKIEKESGIHVEVADLGDRPETPAAASPLALTPVESTATHGSKDPFERLRPNMSKTRSDSIFSQRKVELTGIDPEELAKAEANGMVDGKGRKMSTKTEVLMPAWQFFKLLPWYTDHQPTSDAQVAAHFARKRPVLGICLKRYAYTNQGQATRRSDYIDIPLEIVVPHFVSDDDMQDDGPLAGNFRLLLQSVVCHRGVSVNSGHYITLCRGMAPNAHDQRPPIDHTLNSEATSSSSDDEVEDPWMRFDDLAPERVSYVNIHEALKQETPYLLFYQVQPIDDDGHSIH